MTVEAIRSFRQFAVVFGSTHFSHTHINLMNEAWLYLTILTYPPCYDNELG
jgi:hypothetical protein